MKQLFFFLFFISVCGILVRSASLYEQCSKEYQKVSPCLLFATAKAATPTNECCDMAESIRGSQPACLCYIIQQIHNGSSPETRNMGLQEARLLQLPSVCKLANASVADCPRLLGLAPNSPGAAIFTNPSNATTGTTSSSPAISDSSSGLWLQPQIAIIMLFYAFSALDHLFY